VQSLRFGRASILFFQHQQGGHCPMMVDLASYNIFVGKQGVF
jgi:hypothetical protein